MKEFDLNGEQGKRLQLAMREYHWCFVVLPPKDGMIGIAALSAEVAAVVPVPLAECYFEDQEAAKNHVNDLNHSLGLSPMDEQAIVLAAVVIQKSGLAPQNMWEVMAQQLAAQLSAGRNEIFSSFGAVQITDADISKFLSMIAGAPKIIRAFHSALDEVERTLAEIAASPVAGKDAEAAKAMNALKEKFVEARRLMTPINPSIPPENEAAATQDFAPASQAPTPPRVVTTLENFDQTAGKKVNSEDIGHA